MGVTYETVQVRNILTQGEPVDLTVKVDTGATMLVIPGPLQEQFQFPTIRQETVQYANEERARRDVVYGVQVTVCERTGVFEAIVEPARSIGLPGAIVMEALDLIVEPRSQGLYPNPRSPDLPMADVE